MQIYFSHLWSDLSRIPTILPTSVLYCMQFRTQWWSFFCVNANSPHDIWQESDEKTKQWTKFVASSLPSPSRPGITWWWHFKKRKPIQWKFTWCRESEIWKFRLPRKKKFTGLLLEKTLSLHLHFSSTYFTNNRKSLRDVFTPPDRK